MSQAAGRPCGTPSASDTQAETVAPDGDALGRRFRYVRGTDGNELPGLPVDRWFEVVGIVGNLPVTTEARVAYHVAVPGQIQPAHLQFRLRGDPAGLAERLRTLAAGVDPALHVDQVRTLAEIYREHRFGDNLERVGLGLRLGTSLSFPGRRLPDRDLCVVDPLQELRNTKLVDAGGAQLGFVIERVLHGLGKPDGNHARGLRLGVASLEQPLSGHVKSISAVASSTDFMSADVKVYQTLVSIDEPADSLKPNMSAEVTVKMAERKGVTAPIAKIEMRSSPSTP